MCYQRELYGDRAYNHHAQEVQAGRLNSGSLGYIVKTLSQKQSQLLAHACNSSYLGGRNQEDHGSKSA
jgi:hypothetical protein